MANSRATNRYVKLFTNILASDGTAFATYTPPGGLNLATKYSKIIIQVTGFTATAGRIRMLINAGTDYDLNWTMNDVGTVTSGTTDASTVWNLAQSTIAAAGQPFYIECSIALAESEAGLSYFVINGLSSQHSGHEIVTGNMQINVTDQLIDTILIDASQNMDAKSELIIYGILR